MIHNIENWKNKTSEQILEELNQTTWVPSNRNVLISDLKSILTQDEYIIVMSTLSIARNPVDNTPEALYKAAEMDSAFVAMSTSGLNLSSESRLIIIDQLAISGSWSNEIVNKIKSLCGFNKAKWETLGAISQPTIESITTEKEYLLFMEKRGYIENEILSSANNLNDYLLALKNAVAYLENN